jgi:rRNA maturation protein Nop10
VFRGKSSTMTFLDELDEASNGPDFSSDFNPVAVAKDTDFCEHGNLVLCQECGTHIPRVQPPREAKHDAYDRIRRELLLVDRNDLESGDDDDATATALRKLS